MDVLSNERYRTLEGIWNSLVSSAPPPEPVVKAKAPEVKCSTLVTWRCSFDTNKLITIGRFCLVTIQNSRLILVLDNGIYPRPGKLSLQQTNLWYDGWVIMMLCVSDGPSNISIANDHYANLIFALNGLQQRLVIPPG